MSRLLLLFAHPAFERSRIHRALLAAARTVPGVTIRDLYQLYPDFDVDAAAEQEALLAHDHVLIQFPLYWYATPPLVKQWEDIVLEHGWAYGRTGRQLEGKRLQCVVTAGGPETAYGPDGFNQVPIRTFLLPIEATARLCRLQYLPPWIVHGSHRLESPSIAQAAERYRSFLEAAVGDRIDWSTEAAHDHFDALTGPEPHRA